MKPKKKLKVCGSITKKESLAKITSNIMEHTIVVEANQPYSNYYGKIPEKPEPNSLFLFTERYFTLEEALRFTQNIDICAKNKVNVASAVFLFLNIRVPAIRIKNFPDYQHIKMLQECYVKLGVDFARKVAFEKEALLTVTKCFSLTCIDEGLYLDNENKNEGYITVPKRFEFHEFTELMKTVKNNSECMFFDAAMGGLIVDGRVEEMLRIYSGHLSLDLLKCIKKEISKWI